MHLPSQTLLQGGRYKIIEKIGQGGFGIAYKAYHKGLKRDVCIKEFFFSDFCDRSDYSPNVTIVSTSAEKIQLVDTFRKKFIKEGQRLATFQHVNIVQVMDNFEENNTAYIVMEYIEGGSLEEMISRSGALTEQKTKKLILPILDAMEILHNKGLLHLDIKPANIMLRKDQSPVLIDFGISKYLEIGYGNTTTAPVGISKGYAPLEQYGGSISDFTKSTDIYSLCATMYKMLTGITPPEPLQILGGGLKSPLKLCPQLSKDLDSLILKGLSMKATDRQQSVAELTKSLRVKINEKTISIKDKTVLIDSNQTLASANDYFQRAEKKREKKEFEPAIKDYNEAIYKNPKEKNYFFFRALCNHELNNYDASIEDYSKVIELYPDENAAFFNRGLCYTEKYNSTKVGGYLLSSYLALAVDDFYQAFELKQENQYFDIWYRNILLILNNSTLDKYLENDWPNKDKVYYVRGRNYLVLEERDKGIENLNKANELGNSDAKVLLSETKWHSPKLLIETIVLAISNIIICYGTYLLLLAKIYPTPIWLVLLCTIGGVFLFTRCIPFNSFDFGSREILHPYTSKWFQLLEKIILSIVHILVFCILIFAIISCLKSTSNFGSGIIITIILLIFMIIPYLGLRYIWKKS